MAQYSMAKIVIKRHIKVRAQANPYDPDYAEYVERRRCFPWRTRLRQGYGAAGLYPVERLFKSFRRVYKETQDAEVQPTDCRDAPHGNILGKARAV